MVDAQARECPSQLIALSDSGHAAISAGHRFRKIDDLDVQPT